MDPLMVDLYAGDGRTAADIATLAKAGPPWHGLYLKATQGTTYRSDWFARNWALAHTQVHPDWFAGAYHYLVTHEDPVRQAHFFLREVRKAGGWFKNTLPMWVDVERGGQSGTITSAGVADCILRFTECIEVESGRAPILYGGEYIRSIRLGEQGWVGCSGIVVAAYTPTLDPNYYTQFGFEYGKGNTQLWGWQYCGDGDAKLAGYPHTTPLGPEDITAVTMNGGGDAALAYLRQPRPEVIG